MTGQSGEPRDLFDVVMLGAYLIGHLVCLVWFIYVMNNRRASVLTWH
jgi:hypothetical protein